jgi:hypothetical protein
MAFIINEVWAYVSKNDGGDEGICGFQDPRTKQWLPMIAGDKERLQVLRPFAHQIAKVTNKKVTLVRLSVREDLETIDP